MCIARVFNFLGCKHSVVRTSRCLIVCQTPEVRDRYRHAGECPNCLNGVTFPAQSFGNGPASSVVLSPESAEVLENSRKRAEVILQFITVCYIGGMYDYTRNGRSSRGAVEPWSPQDEKLFARTVLTHFMDTTRCENGHCDLLGETCSCLGTQSVTECTGNLARSHHYQFVRDIFLTHFLPGIQNGQYDDILGELMSISATAASLSPDLAARLVHRDDFAAELVLDSTFQSSCQLASSAQIGAFEDILADRPQLQGATAAAGEVRRARLSRDPMEFAYFLLALDTGLTFDSIEQTLDYLRPVLVDSPYNSPQLGGQMDPDIVSTYQRVLRRYAKQSRREDRLPGLSKHQDMLHHIITTYARSLRKSGKMGRQFTKEELMRARVRLYGEEQAELPAPDWSCCVCLEATLPSVVKLSCSHCLHVDCIVNGLCAANHGNNFNLCFYCRQESIGPADRDVVDWQDEPWFEISGMVG